MPTRIEPWLKEYASTYWTVLHTSFSEGVAKKMNGMSELFFVVEYFNGGFITRCFGLSTLLLLLF